MSDKDRPNHIDESRIAVAMACRLALKLEKVGVVIDKAFGNWRKTRLLWAGP
jgi:hypothetical protein